MKHQGKNKEPHEQLRPRTDESGVQDNDRDDRAKQAADTPAPTPAQSSVPGKSGS